MKASWWIIVVLAILGLLSLAGGWAVVTLDALPEGVVAGQPLTLAFMVRQHGRTPLAGLQPVIRATNPATGEQVTATAKAEGQVGRYVATLVFPSAGTWNWEIDAFGPVAKMPPLAVAATPPPSVPVESSGRLALAGAAALIGLVGTVLGLRAGRERQEPG